VVYLSSAGEQVLGYGPGKAEGVSIFDLLRPEERGTLQQALDAAFRDEPVSGLAFEARTREGEEIVLENSATLVQGIGDGPDLVLWIARDATRARRAEEEQSRLEARLRQAERMEAVGQLAGGIAHDFNNLLLALRGYGELALRRIERKEDGAEADVHEMLEAADRAAGLTRQLLAFGRRQVLNPEVLDLAKVVGELDERIRRAVGEHVELVTIPPPEPVLVKADRGQLEQVITNLAENSRDAMPNGGRLTIGVSMAQLDPSLGAPAARDGLCAVLTVTDTGTGMDAETAARIFEPFFTTKEEKGTGLGLATVHGIVTQSGGHLGVYTAVGKGTAFEVYLPLSEARAAEPSLPVAPPEAGEADSGQKILLIEDDANVRSIVQMMLEDRGYRVLSAGGGEDALTLLEEHGAPVHLALSDLIMRGLNGRETVERLRERQPGLRVLYMSGYTDDAVVRGGGLNAGTGFIQKPFSGEELGRRIRELLELEAAA
jgi:PAS domain S-box-containing protein